MSFRDLCIQQGWNCPHFRVARDFLGSTELLSLGIDECFGQAGFEINDFEYDDWFSNSQLQVLAIKLGQLSGGDGTRIKLILVNQTDFRSARHLVFPADMATFPNELRIYIHWQRTKPLAPGQNDRLVGHFSGISSMPWDSSEDTNGTGQWNMSFNRKYANAEERNEYYAGEIEDEDKQSKGKQSKGKQSKRKRGEGAKASRSYIKSTYPKRDALLFATGCLNFNPLTGIRVMPNSVVNNKRLWKLMRGKGDESGLSHKLRTDRTDLLNAIGKGNSFIPEDALLTGKERTAFVNSHAENNAARSSASITAAIDRYLSGEIVPPVIPTAQYLWRLANSVVEKKKGKGEKKAKDEPAALKARSQTRDPSRSQTRSQSRSTDFESAVESSVESAMESSPEPEPPLHVGTPNQWTYPAPGMDNDDFRGNPTMPYSAIPSQSQLQASERNREDARLRSRTRARRTVRPPALPVNTMTAPTLVGAGVVAGHSEALPRSESTGAQVQTRAQSSRISPPRSASASVTPLHRYPTRSAVRTATPLEDESQSGEEESNGAHRRKNQKKQ